ncbi:MAG: hypothetical protein FJX80_04535 [Bacteroidetes bacterium]|nr:hypothetical protein [Bacteroidota bacterium]
MKNYIFIALAASTFLVSCKPKKTAAPSSSKIINNYATTTDNIFNLSNGMSLEDVRRTLDCEPTDVYYNLKNNQKVLVFKYRKNYQKVPVKQKDHEKFLRGGKPLYKDEDNLYTVFDSKTNKLQYFVTDSGRKAGKREIMEALKLKLKN